MIGVLALLVIGLGLLAGSLPGMRLGPGQPFRLPENKDDIAALLASSDLPTRGFFWLRGILAVALIVYPIYIIISILSKHGRQRLINDLIRLGILALFLYLMNKRGVDLLNRMQSGLAVNALGAVEVPESVPLAVFSSTTPGWAPVALLAGGAVLLVAFIAVIAWWWFMPGGGGKGSVQDSALLQLSGEAQQAVEEIDAGAQVQDVVLRAYYRMEKILLDERKLARPEAMTTSEFAKSLNAQGFPGGAVNDLTRLFEAVRYGHQHLTADQQQRAVSALKAIALTHG